MPTLSALSLDISIARALHHPTYLVHAIIAQDDDPQAHALHGARA